MVAPLWHNDRRAKIDAATEGGAGFLPFEGDRVLSIILSKAFMLAEDVGIRDKSIVRQIERG